MPTKSARFRLDPGTEVDLAALATACHVTVSAAAAVAVDQANANPVVSARAQGTLDAWRNGSAVDWRALALPTCTRTLTLSMGAWTPETNPALPFTRAGIGVAANFRFNDSAVVASTRALWRGALPSGSARIVAFRYGAPVAHLWGNQWSRFGDRIWASECWVAHPTGWVDADTGIVQGQLDAEDQAVEKALLATVVYPSASRNPVSWLTKAGVR